jgi:glycine cleavage system regulatory protein
MGNDFGSFAAECGAAIGASHVTFVGSPFSGVLLVARAGAEMALVGLGLAHLALEGGTTLIAG